MENAVLISPSSVTTESSRSPTEDSDPPPDFPAKIELHIHVPETAPFPAPESERVRELEAALAEERHQRCAHSADDLFASSHSCACIFWTEWRRKPIC